MSDTVKWDEHDYYMVAYIATNTPSLMAQNVPGATSRRELAAWALGGWHAKLGVEPANKAMVESMLKSYARPVEGGEGE